MLSDLSLYIGNACPVYDTIVKNRAAPRTRQQGQDIRDKTARTRQLGHGSLDKTAGTRPTLRTRKQGQDFKKDNTNETALTRQQVQDSSEKGVGTKQLGPDSRDKTAWKRQQ
jgi:hypothetical protein